jgi:hypothetical protein
VYVPEGITQEKVATPAFRIVYVHVLPAANTVPSAVIEPVNTPIDNVAYAERAFAKSLARFALSKLEATVGIMIAAKTAKIAMTTINSIKVKPFLFLTFLNMVSVSFISSIKHQRGKIVNMN